MSIEKSGFQEFTIAITKVEFADDDSEAQSSSGCCASGTRG